MRSITKMTNVDLFSLISSISWRYSPGFFSGFFIFDIGKYHPDYI